MLELFHNEAREPLFGDVTGISLLQFCSSWHFISHKDFQFSFSICAVYQILLLK